MVDIDNAVLVVGEFDGFHLGHRDLIAAADAVARRHRAPLDAVVLDDRARCGLLTDPATRCRELLAAGARTARVIEIDDEISTIDGIDDEISALDATGDGVDGTGTGSDGSARGAASIVDRLVDHARPVAVVMSCPPSTPSNPSVPSTPGDATRPQLRGALERRGVPVIEVDRAHTGDDQPITSALISSLLQAGRVDEATVLLGRPFRVEGEVVRGNQLGRTIGFPTANLTPDERMAIPANGVYAAGVTVGPWTFRAAVNIGTRPTVDDRGITVIEAHLLDHSDDLYGRWIRVEFLRRLRDERRFESLDALTEQLARDVAAVRAIP